MEVANASLYDGATACAEAVAMAGRVTRRNKAVLSGGLHPHYRAVCETYARFAGNELAIAGRGARRRRGSRGADRRRHRLRRRAEPGFLRRGARLFGAGAKSATRPGALLVVVVTEIVSLGAIRPPGEMGADIVAAEGQSLGNALNFGGPYVGLFATPRKIRAADAGAAGRRDRRCRRQARLGADPVDPRAAHPPREGDEQHLHQFRALRARLYDPSGAARRSRADPAGAAQPRDRGARPPRRLAAIPGVRAGQPELLQRIRIAAAAPGGGGRRGAGRTRNILGGIPVSRFYPGRADLADLLLVAATETVTEDDIDRLETGLGEVLR